MQVLDEARGVVASVIELRTGVFAGLLEDGTPFLVANLNLRIRGDLVGRSCQFIPAQVNNDGGDAYSVALELRF